MAPSINIHRTKLQRADELYAEHKGRLLSPPDIEHLPDLPPWTRHSFRVAKGQTCDIVISGLGWIQLNSDKGALLEVYAPRGVRVIMRETMI
jgi:ribosome biogenesis GTPase A